MYTETAERVEVELLYEIVLRLAEVRHILEAVWILKCRGTSSKLTVTLDYRFSA